MFKRNSYLAGLSIIVIAIVVVLNLVVAQLPSNIREFDLTDNSLYSVSDTSIEFLGKLTEDVEIVILSEQDSVDPRITKFLGNYAAVSDHLKLSYKDPIAYPSLLTEYEAENNTVVVRCQATGKKRNIPISDIIKSEMSYYTFSSQETAFDAEGQLTAAVDYVTKDTSETVCQTASHGEEALGTTVKDSLEKANLSLQSVSLLREGKVPDTCSILLSNAPESDLAEDELTMLRDYASNGGRILLTMRDNEKDYPNYQALMSDFGLELSDGLIADKDRYYQQFRSYYALFPVISTTSAVTSGLSQDDLVLIMNSRGFTQAETLPENVAVTPFLTTSSNAFSVKAGVETQGTYLLGATAENSSTNGTLTVIGSYSLIDDSILTSFSNVKNLTIFANAVTEKMEDVAAITIPSKSLSVTYNSIPNAGLWSTLFIGVIPVAILIFGLVYWLQRRKL